MFGDVLDRLLVNFISLVFIGHCVVLFLYCLFDPEVIVELYIVNV